MATQKLGSFWVEISKLARRIRLLESGVVILPIKMLQVAKQEIDSLTMWIKHYIMSRISDHIFSSSLILILISSSWGYRIS